ncbi:MAG: hypothetical protein ACHQRM_10540 [Bacteroidia bacterium]
MKELHDDIDQLFKAGMGAGESPVPDSAWSRLENKLESRELQIYKKKVRGYRMMTASLALLLLLVGLYEFRNYGTGTLTLQPALTNDVSKDIRKEVQSAQALPGEKKNAIVNEKKKDGKSPLSSSFIASNNNITSSSVSNQTNDAVVTNQTTNAVVKEHTSAPASAAYTQIVESPLTSGAAELNGSETEREYLPLISEKDPGLLSGISYPDEQPIPREPFTPSLPPSISVPKLQRFSFSIFFAPDLSTRYLSDDNDDDKKPASATKRNSDHKEDEMAEFSYHAGIKAGYDLNKNWTVVSGVSFVSLLQGLKNSTIYATSLNHQNPHFELSTSAGTAILPNVNGTPGSQDSMNIGSHTREELRFIRIPLLIQYNLYKGRFCFYASGGPTFSYLFSECLDVEIHTASGAGEIHKITSLSGLNDFNFGVNAAMGMKYGVSNHLSLMLAPEFNYMLTPINNNTSVKSYPFAFGLGIGASWHF